MPTWLLVAIVLLVGCGVASYTTALICNKEFESDWQVIRYTGDSIEPRDIYVCKNCRFQSDINHHYCNNCGALMINGITRVYYSDKTVIKII